MLIVFLSVSIIYLFIANTKCRVYLLNKKKLLYLRLISIYNSINVTVILVSKYF